MLLPTQGRQVSGLLVWLLIVFLAAGLGALASVDAGQFYLQLERPAWAPPASVFGPVWTLLYTLMGVAAWLVWRRGGFALRRVPLTLFLVQLAINALWSWLFFAWHLGGAAFADILVLLALLGATLATFWNVSRMAGALLMPYALWVGFAALLNFSVWQLNPQALG